VTTTAPQRAPEVSSALLEVKDLSVHFPTPRGALRAVDGISFSVRAGQTLGIVGESGSGKSVAARALMGLLPRAATRPSGSILFQGQELTTLAPEALRRLLGAEMSMVFQDPMTALNPVVRIGRQVGEGLRIHHGVDRAGARRQSVDMLRRVGIPEPERRLSAYPYEMSGGMRQRVCIAAALVCGPKLLVADEPTTALDVTIQRQILDLLAEFGGSGMSMILITHNLGVAAGRTDTIAVMYSGRIVEMAPTRTLFAHARHPYTRALLRSIPRLSDPGHTRLETIPGRQVRSAQPQAGCRFAERCLSAQPTCLAEEPVLAERDGDTGHASACFYPAGTERGEQALLTNRAAGRTATGLPVDPA
jgi:peptide/nickel transport system ATP-binding protein